MPIEARWLIEGAIIINAAWGDIDMEDMRTMFYGTRSLMDQTTHIWGHIITDARGIVRMPSMLEVTRSMRDFPPHPRTGWVINVRSANPVLSFITDVAMQLTKQRSRTLPTMTGGLEFLQSVDTHLDWSRLPADYAARDRLFDGTGNPVG
ncbi:MAG: hypothetical protein SGJ24_09570 [Chloroflexota bacterium]|nr:hypothetical protein [Chloroflexota bacterium]